MTTSTQEDELRKLITVDDSMHWRANDANALYDLVPVEYAIEKAAKYIEALIQQKQLEAIYKERRNLLLKMKQAPPIDWIDAQTWIDQHLARLDELEAQLSTPPKKEEK